MSPVVSPQAASKIPSFDGDLIRYSPRRTFSCSVLASELLVFVNGIQTSPVEHANKAQEFADITRHDVLGCYNAKGANVLLLAHALADKLAEGVAAFRRDQKRKIGAVADGFDAMGRAMPLLAFPMAAEFYWLGASTRLQGYVWDGLLTSLEATIKGANAAGLGLADLITDLVQCVADWTLPLSGDAIRAASAEADRISDRLAADPFSPYDLVIQPDKTLLILLMGVAAQPERMTRRQRRAFALALMSRTNQASLALFNLLFDRCRLNSTLHIICHSQGNLIVSDVLNLLDWVLGSQFKAPVHVFGLASPATRAAWPTLKGRLDLRLYENVADPVGWLSGWWIPGLRPEGKIASFSDGNVLPTTHLLSNYQKNKGFIADLKADFRVYD